MTVVLILAALVVGVGIGTFFSGKIVTELRLVRQAAFDTEASLHTHISALESQLKGAVAVLPLVRTPGAAPAGQDPPSVQA